MNNRSWPAQHGLLRNALLASTALTLCVALPASVVLANGGGASGTLTPGGVDSATGIGGAGGNADIFAGGAGGGAGAMGGVGGRGYGSGSNAAGGQIPGAAGTNGSSGAAGSNQGGGGGGGGAHGSVGALPGAAVTGGAGGIGGNSSEFDGGGGGAGGYGAVVTTGGALGTLSVNATGGNGGNGGSGFNMGGGGSGGVGLFIANGTSLTIGSALIGGNGGTSNLGSFTPQSGGSGGSGAVIGLTGFTLTNAGSVTGGNGGTGTNNGAGGVGVSGAGLTVINAGAISGGVSGGGSRANAITFTGGASRLELQAPVAGGTYSGITGNVVVQSGSGTLALGGSNSKTFDISALGAAAQYQGFTAFEKTGTSTWSLNGTTGAVTPWTIKQGTLSILQDGSLGASSGGLTFDGGAIGGAASLSMSRAITLGAGGGTFDITGGTTWSVGGIVSGGGALSKLSFGTLSLSGVNSYTGATSIFGGTLALSGSGSVASSSGISFGVGGTFDISGVNGSSSSVVSLSGAGSVNLGAKTLIVTNGAGSTFSGVATGSGGLTLSGGSLTLAGTNTYTGATTINAGALTLNNSGGTALADTGRVTFANVAGTGAALNTNFSETIGSLSGGNTSSSVAIASGRTLTVGADNTADANYAGAVTGGLLTKVGTGTQTLSGTSNYSGATTISGGTLRGGATDSFSANSAFAVNSGTFLDLGGFGETIGSLSGAGTLTNSGTTPATLTAGGNGASTTFSGVIQNGANPAATTGLTKTGTGMLMLSGANTYTGATTISDGTLRAGAANVISTASAVQVNGGTFDLNNNNQSIGSLSGNAGTTVALGSATLTTGSDNTSTGSFGVITGTGGLTKTGTGIFEIRGANTYTGTTTVNAGTLRNGPGGSFASTNFVINGGSLIFNTATTAPATSAVTQTGGQFTVGTSLEIGSLNGGGGGVLLSAGATLTTGRNGTADTYSGNIGIDGNGALTKAGVGTFTLTGANTYVEATTISGGTLRIGDGTAAGNNGRIGQNAGGTVFSNVATTGGTLAFARTNAYTYGGIISGSGIVNQVGSGVTTLTGASTGFSGMANVDAGTLSINGTLGNGAAIVDVNSGGTLHGSGTIAGSVVVANGGTVSAGNSPGTLTVGGDYTLNAGSTSLFELGAPGVVGGANNDLIRVGGNLSVSNASTLALQTAAGGQIASGYYTLFDVAGTTAAGRFGTVSNGGVNATADVSQIVTNGGTGPSQYNVLLASNGQIVQFWDGGNLSANSTVDGGAGTWNATSTNWTTVDGSINDRWRSQAGVFGGAAGGAVTVAGTQSFQGLQFSTNGYSLTGGALALVADSGITGSTAASITVDSGVGTTIGNVLQGSAGLTKFGGGTLTLAGANTYTGLTTVTGGTLALTSSGSLAGDVNNAAAFTNAGTVAGSLANSGTASNDGTIGGGVSNSGSFVNTASGTVSGGLTNTSGTASNAGFVNGGATILAGVFNTDAATSVVNGTLANSGTVNAQGQINGSVANNAGAVFTVVGGLSGIGRFTNDGALALGGNSLSVGSLAGTTAAASITGGGTLTAGGDNSSTSYAGTISGATGLTKQGTGTLTLSGANTYTGATTVSAGTLQAGAANAFSSGSAVTVASSGRMDLNGFNQTVASLSGAGSVTLGAGTLTTGGSNAATGYAGVISGTGGLIKTGIGAFTLSGANTYTGATTVSAGTLALAAGSSLAGSVNNAATFTSAGSVAGGLSNTGAVTASAGRIDGAIANNGGSFTVSGNVASNGTFANASGATLAVTGTGAYGLAGLLTNAGSLTVASGGSLTAPAGITNSGTITVAQGGTIIDALANSGSVLNDGAYTADVTNTASGTIANRATGVWTGTLTANTGSVSNAGQWQGDGRNDAGGSVTNTGTWTTVTGPFVNAGTLVTSGALNGGLANTGSVQASGQINGAVSNAAGASITLTGALTRVTAFANNGLLDLGGTAFTVGSLSGTGITAVIRNGALSTGGDNTSTSYAGAIADGAAATSLTKTGTGNLTLTGTNTYSGGTTINAGTIVATATGLGSGAVTNNAVLVINQAGDATLGSAVNGTGSFTKQGAGTLTYTGTGTLSGPTTVATGGLVVNGSLTASPVIVARGAIVGGTGTLGGLTVQAGATVAPGASSAVGNLGTLNVAGNVLFASQSTYRVDAAAAGQSDRIAASGTATLQGGTVQVIAGTGDYAPSTRYTILSAAGGVSGQFAGVNANFAFLTPSLAYDANDAYLTLSRNEQQFGTAAITRNQRNVAIAAEALGVGTRLYDGIAVLSAPQARKAFDALSGEIHSSAVSAQFTSGELVREAILDRLRFGELPSFTGFSADGIGQRFAPGTTLPALYTADLPSRSAAPAPVTTQLIDPNPVAVWGQGFGSFGSIGGDGNAARLDQQTSGFVLGADTRIDNNWRVGVAGGYTFTTLDVTARQSRGTAENGFGALYAGGSFGPVQMRLGGSYAGSSLTTSRTVVFPGFSETESARYGGSLAQAFGEVGYRIGSTAAYVEPFVGGAAIRVSRDGFTERGGVAALTSASRDYDVATSTIGLQAQAQLSAVFDTSAPIFVRGLIGYRRAYGDVVPSTLFTFGAAGPSFLTAGVPVARDALVAEAGLDWQVSRTTTLSVNYTGQVGADRTQVHGVKGGFVYRW